MRRRKPPGCMPLVLIDDDLDRPRHLLADFEHVLDRRQLIELSAKNHQRTAKIGYPRSQVEALNEFVELGFILVAGHEHEAILVSRRRFLEDLGEARFETWKADHNAAKPLGDRVGEDGRGVRAEASSKNTDPVLIEVLSRVDPGDASPAGIGEVVTLRPCIRGSDCPGPSIASAAKPRSSILSP